MYAFQQIPEIFNSKHYRFYIILSILYSFQMSVFFMLFPSFIKYIVINIILMLCYIMMFLILLEQFKNK